MEDKLASLEITVLSAEDLTHSRRPVQKNAFVVVRTGAAGTHAASTTPHTDGGSFPRWNQKLRLSLPRSSRSVVVEVRCKAGPEERFLGEASIPVSDFCGGELPSDYLHFLSYRLRDRRGERNGIINLSIRAHGVQLPVHRPAPAFSWVPGGKPDSAGVAVGIPVPAYGYTTISKDLN